MLAEPNPARAAHVEETFDMVEVARGVVPDDDAELATSLHTVVLWTAKWLAYADATPLSWVTHRLDRAERPAVPTDGGVYTLLVQPGVAAHPAASFLMYVGKAKNLRNRFEQYLGSERRLTGRPKIYRRLIRYSDHLWFCCAPLPGVANDVLRQVEDALLMAYVPAWNDQLPAEISGVVRAFR